MLRCSSNREASFRGSRNLASKVISPHSSPQPYQLEELYNPNTDTVPMCHYQGSDIFISKSWNLLIRGTLLPNHHLAAVFPRSSGRKQVLGTSEQLEKAVYPPSPRYTIHIAGPQRPGSQHPGSQYPRHDCLGTSSLRGPNLRGPVLTRDATLHTQSPRIDSPNNDKQKPSPIIPLAYTRPARYAQR